MTSKRIPQENTSFSFFPTGWAQTLRSSALVQHVGCNPAWILLFEIQKSPPTNMEYFYLTVPSCSALVRQLEAHGLAGQRTLTTTCKGYNYVQGLTVLARGRVIMTQRDW